MKLTVKAHVKQRIVSASTIDRGSWELGTREFDRIEATASELSGVTVVIPKSPCVKFIIFPSFILVN